ncbi:hypothetical protein BDR04DRAFT_1101411 [Suillus decipiens]|nr:hypothetical protein BDR04DRAFT_1101411 [Suillus decipiens]
METKNVEAIRSSQHAHSRCGSGISSFLPTSTRCIMIAELRWKIFEQIAPPDMPVGRLLELSTWRMEFELTSMRKDLLSLALTCKSFAGPALDLLWRHLGGVEPLIWCLPQSLWKKDGKKLEFQRTMTLDDWSIFCKYNHRVRSLLNKCYKDYSTDTICSTEIWRALNHPPFSLPLLSNLTSLTWTETSNETFHYIRLFVAPKLTMLNISVSSSFTFSPTEQSILSSIAKSCPSISHLDLDFVRYGDESTELVENTTTLLQSWSQLISSRTRTVSEAAITYLSNSPSLRVLKFTLPSTVISVDTQKLLRRPAFGALQELDIECKNMDLLDAFLKQLAISPKVLSFTITHGVNSAQTLPALISRLCNLCADNSLQRVQLSITDWPAIHNTSIESGAFRPLFAFRDLRKFNFMMDSRCVVRMDDADLVEMAKAWPLLEELLIPGYSQAGHQVTPHAFVSLLWHCPRLVSVAVPVDWITIDYSGIPRDIPYQGFSHNAVSELVFRGSKIDNPLRIAAFISAIAPNVTSIEEDEFDGDSRDSGWSIVNSIIRDIPMVRKQGMKMMLNGLMRRSYNHRAAQQGGCR